MSRLGYRQEDQQKFWSHVEQCPHGETCQGCCWLWMSTRDKNGYGYFRVQAHRYRWESSAHRYAYEMRHGNLFPGLHVLHRCDTPACVNPAHLWLGTHGDNMADMRKKGRAHTSEQFTKLTEENVRDIRYLRSVGMPRPLVSTIYQIDPGTVTRILTGKRRRNVA